MPYTVHTPDGQAHTYPDPVRPEVSHDGQVLTMRTLPKASSGEYIEGWPVSVYAPGQWTHLYLHPAPYETDEGTKDQAIIANAEAQANATVQPYEGRDKWQAEFQRHLDAGRKAARAR